MAQAKLNFPPIPRLRKLMEDRQVKRDDLAQAIGVSSVAIGQYYNGETLPTIDKLIKIANYFNVSTDYLLGKSDVHTSDTTIKGICEYTGLSEETVKKLSSIAEYNKKYPELDNTLEHLDTFIQRGAMSIFKYLDEYLTSVQFCKYLELKYPNTNFNSSGTIVIDTNKNTVNRIPLTEDEKIAKNDYMEEIEKNQPIFRYNINKEFEDFITKYGEYQKEITTTENFEQYINTYNKSAQAHYEYTNTAFNSFIESITKISDHLKKLGITNEVLEKYKKDVDNGNDK